MNPQLLVDLLNRALDQELGLVITTNNPHGMTLKLHDIRKSNLDRWGGIEITIPSTPDTVMLVKKTVELDEVGDLPDVE